MRQEYLAIYERGPENWSGFAPDVPGCISTGASMPELRENLLEALAFHLEGLVLEGIALPEPVTHVVEVPEGGAAEWLTLEMPLREIVSV